MSFLFRCNASKIWSWKFFVEHDRCLSARWYSYVDKVIYLAVTSLIRMNSFCSSRPTLLLYLTTNLLCNAHVMTTVGKVKCFQVETGRANNENDVRTCKFQKTRTTVRIVNYYEHDHSCATSRWQGEVSRVSKKNTKLVATLSAMFRRVTTPDANNTPS